jgi:GMP synthase-like glutamine amidotransferase
MGGQQTQTRMVPSSHPDKVRILVLETDDLHPDTKKDHDGFGNILGELLKKAGDEHEPSLGIETVIQYIIEDKGGKVPEPQDIPDDIHAILITGSVYDAHSDVPWILKLIGLIKRMLAY